jgi:hypothetical protein
VYPAAPMTIRATATACTVKPPAPARRGR